MCESAMGHLLGNRPLSLGRESREGRDENIDVELIRRPPPTPGGCAHQLQADRRHGLDHTGLVSRSSLPKVVPPTATVFRRQRRQQLRLRVVSVSDSDSVAGSVAVAGWRVAMAGVIGGTLPTDEKIASF